MQTIPKLDLSHFTNGSALEKSQFVSDLGHAYEEIGFVAIRNHGIPQSILTELYREVKTFFELPTEIKLRYDDTNGGGQRGYTGFGKEHAKDRNAGDLKEFWHFGQYTEGATIDVPSYPPNKIVEELSGFNQAGENIYKALEQTGIEMLRAIAIHLDLKEGNLEEKVTTEKVI